MSEKLKEIARRHLNKGYGVDSLFDCDDLYDYGTEDKEYCCEYAIEIIKIGIEKLRKEQPDE